tara:strand:+ start:39938 stop:40900 length:963 start_codon:yes stop_codon:yes gene_type:complete
MNIKHSIEASAETVHWGYLSSDIPPIISINSGDTVSLSTISGPPDVVANAPYNVRQALHDVHENPVRGTLQGGHMCTGPVEIKGLVAGNVLQVDILSVELDSDWAYTGVSPLKGALPDDFHEKQMTYLDIDQENMVAKTPWGMSIPLSPFFGVLCTAPPKPWGVLSTVPPRRNGGNMDNKELVAGSTVFLPVFVDGGLFSAGDGHGTQGDGEICTAAVEMNMKGSFKLTSRDDMMLEWPMAETEDNIITMAFDPDLDNCVVIAVRQMVNLLHTYCNISKADAYTLLSYVGNLRVTQVVNGNKGIHLMVNKEFFGNKSFKK